MDTVIEKAGLEDLNELECLYNELNDYLSKHINYPGWIKGIYPVRETAENGINEDSLFILRKNDIIAGSVILNHEPEKAYNQVTWGIETEYENIIVIRTLVVHPSFINKGIGSALIGFTKKLGMDLQMKAIRLDVSENNIPAISLYEKHGYNYVGTVDLGLNYEHLKWFKLYELILD